MSVLGGLRSGSAKRCDAAAVWLYSAAEISDEKDVSVQVRGIDNDAHSEIG
jgi:hypothetical protein